MNYIEVAWRRDSEGITYIDDRIEDLLGYSVEEIKSLARPFISVAPWPKNGFTDFLTGKPNKIIPHAIAPCPLRCRDGSEVLCEVVTICRYDERGDLAELFGMVRNYPRQELLGQLLDWWLVADEAGRQAVCGLADLLDAR